MKFAKDRRNEILYQLHELGSVSVSELSVMFGVSEVTIRNDLNIMEGNGLLLRTHGGALRKKQDYFDPQKNKSKLDVKKENFALAALSQIENGDSVGFGPGSVTESTARKLTSARDVFVITNSVNVLLALANCNGVSAIGTGGCYHADSMSFYGALAEESFSNYNLDKIIFDVDNLHVFFGVSSNNEDEARLYNAMLKVAKKCIIIIDSYKLDTVNFYKIMPCDRVDVLITDNDISDEYHQHMIDSGVEVIVI